MRSIGTMKLRTRMIATCLAIGIVPAVAVATLALWTAGDTAERLSYEKLEALRAVKADYVESYFQTIERQLRVFSGDLMVREAMEQFTDAFASLEEELGERWSADRATLEAGLLERYRYQLAHTDGAEAGPIEGWMPESAQERLLQALYIGSNPHAVGEKHRLDDAGDGSRYSALHDRFHPVFREFLEEFGYYDVFLVEPETGHVVYSVFKEVDFATSLLDGPWAESGIGRAFRAALATEDPAAIAFEDYSAYGPSYGAPAAFAASPVHDAEGRRIGVAVFQMPVDRIDAIMQERAGLGESGETYLVGSDGLMRSDSRFSETPTILKQAVTTATARAALAGETVIDIVEDYRGVPVLSAAAPIDVLGARYAIVAEIDTEEAFASTTVLRDLIVGGLGVVLLLVIAAGALVATRITRPVLAVVDVVKRVAGGDFTVRAQVTGGDEIAELGRAVNRMSEDLEQAITDVSEVAMALAAASEELSAGAGTISDGAMQQSEISSSLAKSIHANARNATGANRIAQATSRRAEEVGHGMSETVASIQAIAESSGRIESAVSIISDIARQTQLLGLNAAVVAARAGGDHGRSFAVVAAEMQKLASRSASSADEIDDLLKGSRAHIARGVDRTRDSEQHLQEIVTEIGDIAEQLETIAGVTEDQAQRTERNTTITDGNAAASEELSAAAESLAAQAATLQSLMERFRVRAATVTSLPVPERVVAVTERPRLKAVG